MKTKHTLFEVEKLMNLTTEMSLLKSQTDKVIEAVEYDKEKIAFEVAENACRQGQLVEIKGIIHMRGLPHPFTGSGKVKETAKLGNKRMKVVIEMHTYNKALWENFNDVLNEAQAQIDKLFKSVRGKE